jgi:nucleoside-diphosphate-sugar epimerase
MRVLVLGGLGFIGSSIVDAFLYQGHDVSVCDDSSSNVIGWSECPLAVYGHYTLDAAQCLEYLADHPGSEGVPDLVVHCANPVGAAGILGLKGRIASETVRTTSAAAEYCAQTGARLVYISSSEVYGKSGTYTESDDLRIPASLSPRIEYAVGKTAAEACVRLMPGLRSVVLRPFNVAGARQQSEGGFVLPTFCEQAAMGWPLTVYGDGMQRRALTGVEDVAAFVLQLRDEHFDGRVVNIGTPANETSIIGLAERVRFLAESESLIEYTTGRAVHGADYAEAEGVVKLPAVALAERMGWRPVWTLDRLVADALSHVRGKVA